MLAFGFTVSGYRFPSCDLSYSSITNPVVVAAAANIRGSGSAHNHHFHFFEGFFAG
jgi:hypothetical protein